MFSVFHVNYIVWDDWLMKYISFCVLACEFCVDFSRNMYFHSMESGVLCEFVLGSYTLFGLTVRPGGNSLWYVLWFFGIHTSLSSKRLKMMALS